MLAAVDVLLHTRHKLLEVLLTNYLLLHQCKNRGDARHHCHLAGLNNGLCLADDLRAFLCYLLQPLTLLFGSERQEINLAQLIPATILKLANASA